MGSCGQENLVFWRAQREKNRGCVASCLDSAYILLFLRVYHLFLGPFRVSPGKKTCDVIFYLADMAGNRTFLPDISDLKLT